MVKKIHQTICISRIDCLKGAWIPNPYSCLRDTFPWFRRHTTPHFCIYTEHPFPGKPCLQDISKHCGSLSLPYQVELCYNTEKTEEALSHNTNRHQKRAHLLRKELTENYNLFFRPQWPWLEQNPGQTVNTEIYWLGDKRGYYRGCYVLITILLMFLAGWIGSV